MKIRLGDSILMSGTRGVAIVEGRIAEYLTVRIPDDGNRRMTVERSQIRPLGELIFERWQNGAKVAFNISLLGKATLSELVATFGYSTSKLRRESLEKVCNQLRRAGLDVRTFSGDWGRDDRFDLFPRQDPVAPSRDDAEIRSEIGPTPVSLPDPFWPTAFGLESNHEIASNEGIIASRDSLAACVDAEWVAGAESSTRRFGLPGLRGLSPSHPCPVPIRTGS
jgi:hypothetical protein